MLLKKQTKVINKKGDKRMKPEGLVYGKHNFNRYGTIISFISNFLTEVTDTD